MARWHEAHASVRPLLSIVIAGVLALSNSPTVGAQSNDRGMLDDYGAGLSAEQARDLRAQNARLSSQYGLTLNVLDAIARAVGARNKGISYADLIARVQNAGRQARDLQQEIARLRTTVSTLEASLKDPAEKALEAAQAAFAAGRLDDADRELAKLAILRQSESTVGLQAWTDAVDARASLAELQQDFLRAKSMHQEAAASLALLQSSVQRLRWRQKLRAAMDDCWLGSSVGDDKALERCLMSLRTDVAALVPRKETPEDWARNQYWIGLALAMMGDRSAGNGRFREAITAFKAAQGIITREKYPDLWAQAEAEVGNALWQIAGRDNALWAFGVSKTKQLTDLEGAITSFRAVLEIIPKDKSPEYWAYMKSKLGTVLQMLGQMNSDGKLVEESIDAQNAALSVFTREKWPSAWAGTQAALGEALTSKGVDQKDSASFEAAIKAYNASLEVSTRDRSPRAWAYTEYSIAGCLTEMGKLETGVVSLDLAIKAYRSALEVFDRQHFGLRWAVMQFELGRALAIRGQREEGTDSLEASIAAMSLTLKFILEYHLTAYQGPLLREMSVTKTLIEKRRKTA